MFAWINYSNIKKQAFLIDPQIDDQVVLVQELRQAKIRNIFSIVTMIVFLMVAVSFSKYQNIFDSSEAYKIFTSLIALIWGSTQVFLFKFYKNIKPSVARILIGQTLDATLTALALSSGEVASIFFVTFLWIIMGNGMRFGRRLLVTCQLISLTAFGISIVLSPYWHKHFELALSYVVILILIPTYFGTLVQSLSKIRDELITKEKDQVDLLRQMDNLKTTFFANISHEFRTPIALTIGSLDMMERNPHEMTAQLPIIKRNQNRLLKMVNEILDLEKMEQKGSQLKFSPMSNCDQFLRRRAEQFQSMAFKKSLKFKVDIETKLKPGEIYLDPESFDKVIFNLLSNAFKFTAKGEILMIALKKDNQLVISVSDSGMGIREDQLPFIFDRFRQASGSESKDYAGTGIGLSLAQEIVKLHLGDIQVKSTYGQGTTFTVVLPLGKAHLPENQLCQQPFFEEDVVKPSVDLINEGLSDTAGIDEHKKWNAKTSLTLDLKKKTILYVDDNYDLRNYLINLIGETYNLLLAWDGLAALEILETHKPDLILSDLMMPRLDGAGLIRKIRLNPDLNEIPFVILTAKALEKTKFDLLDAGADDFLFKPFSREELLVRVRNLLVLREKTTMAKRELLEAKKIQRSLLPAQDIELDKLAISVLYKPCETLSGDFYDILVFEEFILCYVADVTSHGTSAAQITYLIKSTLKSLFEENPAAPVSHILKEFAVRYTDYKLDYGVGIQIFKFNSKTKSLTFANSNSPTALLFKSDGFKSLDLGISPLIDSKFYGESVKSFKEEEIIFDKDDTIFMFTDGCYELSPQEGQAYDDRKLSRDLRKLSKSDDWRDQIFKKLVDQQKSESFPDDITMMRLTAK